MAIVQLDLNYGLDLEQVFQIAKAADLDKQSRSEVVDCWDMVQIWEDWFTENFGTISAVHHRSQPDDPPDLELVFEGRTLGMEHTRLQTKHLGQAAALARKYHAGGFIPPISSPPATFAELKDIVAGVNPVWSTVNDGCSAIFGLLAVGLRDKMRGMPCGGIIGMVQDMVVANSNQRLLGEIAQNIVNRPEFADFANYTLILLDRANILKYHSSLIKRAQDVLERMQ